MESILAQTYTDWELVAVDDFSTDNSLDILQKYAASDPRIHIFKNNKKGIAPALKLAFQNSIGQLITRMDSDDIMHPDKLFLLKNKLTENGTGKVATGMVEYFSEEGIKDGYRKYAEWLNGLSLNENHFTEIYKECVIPSPCWMAYKSDLIKCRAFEEEEVYPEDYDLCFRWRDAGYNTVAVKKTIHHWRDYPKRTSRIDKNYSKNTFLDLKLNWFLKRDYIADRPLVIWGAGKKGKTLAKLLNEKNISFGWVSNNKDKIGHEIRGLELRHFDILKKLKNPQIIVAVASPDGQEEILEFLKKYNFEAMKHYFFFC